MSISLRQKSANSNQMTNQVLTACPKCLATFNFEYYRPMTLQCLHCCCEPCVVEMMTKNKKLICNLCKKQTKLTRDKAADSLPINYSILDMINKNRKDGGASVMVNIHRGDLSKISTGQMSSEIQEITVVPVVQMTSNGKKHNQTNGVSRIPSNFEERGGNKSQSIEKQLNINSERLKNYSDGNQTEKITRSNRIDGSTSQTTLMVMHLQVGTNGKPPPEDTLSKTSAMTSTTSVARSSKTTSTESDATPDSAVTMLSVKSPATQTSVPQKPKPSQSPLRESAPVEPIKITNPSDLCIRCNINPAQLSVANARAMKSQKLCTKCYLIDQQPNAAQADKNDSRSKKNVPQYNDENSISDSMLTIANVCYDPFENQQQPIKTVIRVQDEPAGNKEKHSTSKISTYSDTKIRNNSPLQHEESGITEGKTDDSTDMLLRMLEEYKSNMAQNEKTNKCAHSTKDNNNHYIGRPVSSLIIQPKKKKVPTATLR